MKSTKKLKRKTILGFLIRPIEPQTLTFRLPPPAARCCPPLAAANDGEGPPRPGWTGEVRRRPAGRRAASPSRRPRRGEPVLPITASGVGLGSGTAVAAPVGGWPGAQRHGVRPVGAVPPVRRRRGCCPRTRPELRVRELPAGGGRCGRGAGAPGGSPGWGAC